MSSTNAPARFVLPDNLTQSWLFNVGDAIGVGDLMFDNGSDVARPADKQTSQGSEASDQVLFASLFCGVSQEQILSSETNSTKRFTVRTEGAMEFKCPSQTFNKGDLVGIYSDGVHAPDPQQLDKVSTVDKAIGMVIKSYLSATTTVRVYLLAKNYTGLKSAATNSTFGDIIVASITSSDSSLDIAGQTPTTGNTAGGAVPIVGGTSHGTGNGGAATITGGPSANQTSGTAGAGGAGGSSGGAGGTATTGTGGAGGATSSTGGAGGAASGAAGIGGAGGNSTCSAGVGGAASSSSGGNAGAGGTFTGSGGAGGAASGTGAAAGGAGGTWTGNGGAGGAAAGTSAAGAGGNWTGQGGAGAAKSGTGHAAGGAGGTWTAGGGAGGNTASNGTDAGGAGGAVTLAAGTGGNASAGTGNGGAGGSVTIDTGAGGTSSGGTAGVNGTLNLADTASTSAGTYLNRGALKALQVGLTLTGLGTNQSSTPTSAQLLGGILTQTGATGAGTVTLPSGTNLSAACPRTPVVGDTFDCYFYNLGGSQTLTITGATGTTVIGTAAVGSGKMAQMKFYNSGSNTWNVYVIVSA